MESIREQILAAITAAVGGEYGIPAPDDERDLPITIVDDGQEEAEQDIYGYTTVSMPVVIAKAEAATTADRTTMRQQADELLAQIITTMFADGTFGGLADNLLYTGGEIQTDASKFVFAQAQFTVTYHFVRGNPYQND